MSKFSPLSSRRPVLMMGVALLATGWTPTQAFAARADLVELGLAGDAAAIEELRGLGPVSVEKLLAARPAAGSEDYEAWARALDRVCAQRDCADSGLYWHTDLGSALARAEREDKPVLSLRLLGRLDEEVSCANSRFFRTVLYPDPQVRRVLREEVVLHWQSVRPVPTITIDFGDGRTLAGTVTGNSLHVVLDPRGRVVDLIPGLYGPGMFLETVSAATTLARDGYLLDDKQFALARSMFHGSAVATSRAGLTAARWPVPEGQNAEDTSPTALAAGVLAMSKVAGEGPLVRAMSLASWREQTQHTDWAVLAARLRGTWKLSAESRAFLARKHQAHDHAEATRVAETFEQLVGLDTVHNEYLFHPVVRSWLGADLELEITPDDLVERVYDELFLTPSSDPWLGLYSPDTYLALKPE